MYRISDLVVYGSSGVCRVMEIRSQPFPTTGEERLYYVLQALGDHCTISVPVDSDKVFMRPVISRQEAEALIDSIPQLDAQAYHSKAPRELAEHYEALLKTHDCASLLAMTRSIYLKKQELLRQKRKFGSVDERFLKRAEELLFGELAAALEIPRDKVLDFITARVGSQAGAEQ